MRGVFARTIPILVFCLGTLSNPALGAVMDFQNFGVYQDTHDNGVLDPDDTFLGGFMNWFTYYSAATSYNYGEHYSENNQHPDPLDGFDDLVEAPYYDLTGAPYSADQENDQTLSWLPISDESEDNVLHIYMVWSYWDTNSDEGVADQRTGFSLGLIANSFIRSRSENSYEGGYDLDIAIRNDTSSLPQVTLSDDFNSTGGRPTAPRGRDNSSQELYWIEDPDTNDPYGHHFQGRWEYTTSTADGGIIGGIHNGEYAIDVNLSDVVTTVSGDGLVIRIDPQSFDEISKIIIYDFGYASGADQGNPVELEIPLGTSADKTFFITSIPEVVPEPSSLLSLLVIGGVATLGRWRGKRRI